MGALERHKYRVARDLANSLAAELNAKNDRIAALERVIEHHKGSGSGDLGCRWCQCYCDEGKDPAAKRGG